MTKLVGTIDATFDIEVDVRSRGGGALRILYGVPCRVPVVEGMGTVCRAVLKTGREMTWLGRDGVPMTSGKALFEMLLGKQLDLPFIDGPEQLSVWSGRVSSRDLIEALPDHNTLNGDRIGRGSVNAKPMDWDGDETHLDLSAAKVRIEALRGNIERRIAIQDGVLHIARHLPTWHPEHDSQNVALAATNRLPGMSEYRQGYGSHFLVSTFPPDRLDDALAYQRHCREDGRAQAAGRILELDPAYTGRSSLPDAATAICSWIVQNAKVETASLDAEVVRLWHETSHWALKSTYDVEAAREALVAARAYVEAVKDGPDAFRGRGPNVDRHPLWRNCLARMDIEGIPAPAPRDAAVPRVD